MLRMPTIVRGVDTRVRASRRVEFVCPRCGADRDGVVIEQQRWYCVLRVPLVPLATLDPAVECTTCRHRAGMSVLDVLTSTQLSRCLSTAMRQAIAHVVWSGTDGDGQVGVAAGLAVDIEVVEAAIDVMQACGFDYDAAALEHGLAKHDAADVRRALQPLVDELTPHGKQGFLHRMIAIALADGTLTRREQEAIVAVGVGLGMAAPHINGVLATALLHQVAG